MERRFSRTSTVSWYRRGIILWLALAAALAGGFLTYRLSAIPFGLLFNASVLLCLIGLIVFLLIAGIRLLTSPKPWRKAIGVPLVLLSVSILLASCVITIDHRIVMFKELPPAMTEEMWREYVHYLADTMAERHPDLFSLVTRAVR